MPTYDYKCSEHGHHEVVKSFVFYAREERCPTCGTVMSRVFTPTPSHFKGSGWARDGYSSSGKWDKGSIVGSGFKKD